MVWSQCGSRFGSWAMTSTILTAPPKDPCKDIVVQIIEFSGIMFSPSHGVFCVLSLPHSPPVSRCFNVRITYPFKAGKSSQALALVPSGYKRSCSSHTCITTFRPHDFYVPALWRNPSSWFQRVNRVWYAVTSLGVVRHKHSKFAYSSNPHWQNCWLMFRV